MSDLDRKNAENIADLFNEPPRNLQKFLGTLRWDEEKTTQKVQEIVSRKHDGEEKIGIFDESGHPKKGNKTAGVSRQYCGETGKVENCVVTVHLEYCSDDEFHTLIGSDLFLPEEWFGPEAKDRRKEAEIPEELEFRKKTEMAVELIRTAIQNGVEFDYHTFDSLYGDSPVFLNGLEELGEDYVGEVSKTLTGWIKPPKVLNETGNATEGLKKDQKRKNMELADEDETGIYVRTLAEEHPAFRSQEWTPYKIKETRKGPTVWEVKSAPFYHKRGKYRSKQLRLIVARNVLSGEIKYFLADVPAVTGMRTMLRVGFKRGSIEKNFEDGKQEVGMGDFEVRKYPSIIRHLTLTMVSHLFLADQTDRLRKENSSVTIRQMRKAVETRLDTIELVPSDQKMKIEECSEELEKTQKRNIRSYRAHRRKRIQKLTENGYDIEQIPSCIRKVPYWIEQIE